MSRIAFMLLPLTLLAACATTVGAGDPSTIPADAIDTCTAQCEGLGLQFEGLSIEERSVECICEAD